MHLFTQTFRGNSSINQEPYLSPSFILKSARCTASN